MRVFFILFIFLSVTIYSYSQDLINIYKSDKSVYSSLIVNVDSITFDTNEFKENVRLYRKDKDFFDISSKNIDSIKFEIASSVSPYVITHLKYNRLRKLGLRTFGEIYSNESDPKFIRGFCWNKTGNPSIKDNIVCDTVNENGKYYNELYPSEKGVFYIKSFAKNDHGVFYGNQIEAVIDSTFSPEVSTDEILMDNITPNSALVTGTLNYKGIPTSTDFGVCFALHSEPTVNDNKIKRNTVNISGKFNCIINDLIFDELYYVRSFSISASDTVYGNMVSFRTKEAYIPKLETTPVNIFTKKAAIVCGKVIDKGNLDLLEWGICYSTSINPTIEDYVMPASKSSMAISEEGEYGVLLDNLQPGKRYYVRAYAKNQSGVGYGVQKIFTTLGKNVVKMSYILNKSSNPSDDEQDAYRLITEAMDSAMYYYNNYYNSPTEEKRLDINYNVWVPTAQANCLGDLDFGQNRSYMWVGTALHEIAHTLGSGTDWTWSANLLIDGVYRGNNCKTVVRVFNEDWVTKDILRGDPMHFYPGGINYREEVRRGEIDLKMHALMLTGMKLDGLTDCGNH